MCLTVTHFLVNKPEFKNFAHFRHFIILNNTKMSLVKNSVERILNFLKLWDFQYLCNTCSITPLQGRRIAESQNIVQYLNLLSIITFFLTPGVKRFIMPDGRAWLCANPSHFLCHDFHEEGTFLPLFFNDVPLISVSLLIILDVSVRNYFFFFFFTTRKRTLNLTKE